MAGDPGAKLKGTRCYKTIGTRHNKDPGEKAPALVR